MRALRPPLIFVPMSPYICFICLFFIYIFVYYTQFFINKKLFFCRIPFAVRLGTFFFVRVRTMWQLTWMVKPCSIIMSAWQDSMKTAWLCLSWLKYNIFPTRSRNKVPYDLKRSSKILSQIIFTNTFYFVTLWKSSYQWKFWFVSSTINWLSS